MNRKKLIYSILKELQNGHEPNRKNYDLDLQQWGELLEIIIHEEFAENLEVRRGGQGNKVIDTWESSSKIRLKGIQYLEENSLLAKTYKGIKEIRDWLK